MYSKSLSYMVFSTAVLSNTDFSKVPRSFVLHENLEQCEFLYIWIWVTRIFVLSNTILRVILSWIQMFWAARFLSYTDFPLSQKSCSSRSYCKHWFFRYKLSRKNDPIISILDNQNVGNSIEAHMHFPNCQIFSILIFIYSEPCL